MERERFTAGVFSSLRNKKIRFNLRRFFNPRPFSSETIEVMEEKFVDLHSEIVKKVDALIAANERELFTEELEFIPEEKNDLNTENMVSGIKNNI